MAVQKSYNFAQPVGSAGGLYDLSYHVVDSRLNGEDDGVVKFGMGVVTGDKPGKNVKLPETGTEVAEFEGITISTATEMDKNGKVIVTSGYTLSVMTYGRIWARLKEDIEPEYGTTVYLIISGENAGLFTTEDDATEDTIEINARYIGTRASGDIAPVELYNQMRK